MGYRGKLAQRQRARELRSESWTLLDIATKLGVSKSSVSVWVRDVDFEPRPRNRGHSSHRVHPLRLKKEAEIERCRVEAEEFVVTLTERDFFIWGLAMYHGEGAKTPQSGFQLANTSPTIIAAFLRWVRTFFDVDESRLRATLYLHVDLDEAGAKSYWSGVTSIPVEQFTKSYRPEIRGTHKRTKHVNGCVSIRYRDVSVFRRVMAMSEAITSGFAFRDSSAGRAVDC